MKDKAQKRKERERASHAKVLKRREAFRTQQRDEHKKGLLERQTRRRQEPVRNEFPNPPPFPGEILNEGDLPVSEKYAVDADKLHRNLETLKGFENEYVANDQAREQFKEKLNGNANADANPPGSNACAVGRAVIGGQDQ